MNPKTEEGRNGAGFLTTLRDSCLDSTNLLSRYKERQVSLRDIYVPFFLILSALAGFGACFDRYVYGYPSLPQFQPTLIDSMFYGVQTFVSLLIGVYIVAVITDFFANRYFDGASTVENCTKLSVISHAPSCIGGLLLIVPFIGHVLWLIGVVISLIIFWSNLLLMTGVEPERQTVFFCIVVFLGGIAKVVTFLFFGWLLDV